MLGDTREIVRNAREVVGDARETVGDAQEVARSAWEIGGDDWEIIMNYLKYINKMLLAYKVNHGSAIKE